VKPWAIYYEQEHWFRPLLAELDRRSIPHRRIDPRAHAYDPKAAEPEFSLLFNRMSPSAYLRGGVQGMFFTLGFLDHVQRLGIPIVNGLRAFSIEISKARQLTLLESLRLPTPRSRVINHPSLAAEGLDGWRFPVVFKANVGGSGAGIVRFDNRDDLRRAAAEGRLDFGVDHTALIQEFVPARDSQIVRVELLDGKFLYAIKVGTPGDTFNLCPADICQRSDGVALERTACPVDAPKTGLTVENYSPPAEVVAECELIMRSAAIDVGGIEYMIDDRDGRRLYYDVNALSNFVADAVNVVGFDPFSRLVDYLERRAARSR